MAVRCRTLVALAVAGAMGLIVAGCGPAGPKTVPAPAGTRVIPALPTSTVMVLPSPSPTPMLVQTATPVPVTLPPQAASVTPSVLPTVEHAASVTPTGTSVPVQASPTGPPAPTSAPAAPTAQPPAATSTARSQPPLPPRSGGEWDMEAGFVAGISPLGEECPGWAVAMGWQAFVAPGTPASSCLNENKNLNNVKSGERSQEITFDFISAEAGIFRQAQTILGHRYQIEAWGKHVRSQSPVELSLGVDLSGGEDWQAAWLEWFPWDETEEETWVHTQVTVRASNETMTVFLKGYHPFAAQGGATLFDDVRVMDLGP